MFDSFVCTKHIMMFGNEVFIGAPLLDLSWESVKYSPKD